MGDESRKKKKKIQSIFLAPLKNTGNHLEFIHKETVFKTNLQIIVSSLKFIKQDFYVRKSLFSRAISK